VQLSKNSLTLTLLEPPGSIFGIFLEEAAAFTEKYYSRERSICEGGVIWQKRELSALMGYVI